MKKSKEEGAGSEGSAQWLAFLHLGWMIAVNMALFVGGGLWLDSHYGTTPILLLTGVFLAFAGSGYTLYRAVRKLERDEAEKPNR